MPWFLLSAPVEEKTENRDKNCQNIPPFYASINCKKERVITVIEITYHTPDQTGENVIVKPPKNIRQIGSPRGRHKIYIEDYVHTYLHSSLLFRDQKQRAAILLGRSEVSQEIRYTFIEGAVNCEDFIFQQDGIVFDESCWQYIYQEMKEYFDQMSIVGWFLGRPGFPLKISHTVEAAQRKYFSGRDKVLYLWDPEEGEDVFYAYEQGSFQKKEGYYVYYEKNLSMQEYMVRQRERGREEQGGIQEMMEGLLDAEGEKGTEGEAPEINVSQAEGAAERSAQAEPVFRKREADAAIGNYRSMLMERGKHPSGDKKNLFLYGAATAALIAVCISGVLNLNSYQKMKDMEEVLSMVSQPLKEQQEEQSQGQVTVRNMPGMVNTREEASGGTAAEGSDGAASGQADASGQQPGAPDEAAGQQPGTQEGTGEQQAPSGDGAAEPQSEPQDGAQDQEASGQPEHTGDPQQPQDSNSEDGGEGSQGDAASQEAMAYLEQGYYVVQPGDRLEAICRRIYPGKDMLQKLCEVNKIEDVDKIQAGQKLILP